MNNLNTITRIATNGQIEASRLRQLATVADADLAAELRAEAAELDREAAALHKQEIRCKQPTWRVH